MAPSRRCISLNIKSLPKRVLGFIQRHNLILSGETLLLGVSGGPDSACLLHLLVKLKERLDVKLHIAHLNHGLRGAESEADARYVAELSNRFGLPVTIEKRDVKGFQREHRLSLEEAAREVRYHFFAELAGALGAKKVALGHTSDDQVETILMHLIRGSGTLGLGGMQPLTPWKSLIIVRPLLEVSREETEAYCQEHNLSPRRDSSNLSLSYLRNRIRHELIPLLQIYNPKIKQALLHTATILAKDSSFLKEQTSQIWYRAITKEDGRITLDTKEFASLHPALQRTLVREAISQLLGDLKDIEWKHIESIISALTLPASKRLSLPRGLSLSTQYSKCVISSPSTQSPFPILEGECQLKVPGETLLPGWQVKAIILESAPSFSSEAFKAYFDFDKVGEEIIVRNRRRGDRFQPLGMGEPKKLQDFMVDAKIPREIRDYIPLVCSPQHILWVVGWRIDDRVKVTENTKKILCLGFTNLLR